MHTTTVTLLRLPMRHLSRSRRAFPPITTTSIRRASSSPSSPFTPTPAPPRLPKDEQDLFERLQKQSAAAGAFSTPRGEVASTSPSVSPSPSTKAGEAEVRAAKATTAVVEEGKAGDVEVTTTLHHPNLRRGAPPEFEGEVNPKTGEVGGPKVEPLRWGGGGDWSFNGRVTDF